jgi:hypothetical protein
MARSYPILRASLIALAAIAGLLLTADGAVAASSRGDGCCRVSRPAADCCCESSVSASETGDRPAGMIGAAGTLNRSEEPEGSCECREGGPVAPDGTPGSRSPEERPDSHRPATPVDFAVIDPAVRSWSVRPIAAAPCSSRSPLYLRNARLLI